MTVNEAYLVVPGATVTLNYIPMMTPGLYDTFPGKSRKWTNMPRKRIWMSRKPLWGSRKHITIYKGLH